MGSWYQEGAAADLATLDGFEVVGAMLLDPSYVFDDTHSVVDVEAYESSGGSYGRALLGTTVVSTVVAGQIRLMYDEILYIGRPDNDPGWLVLYRASDGVLLIAEEIWVDTTEDVEVDWTNDVIAIRYTTKQTTYSIPPGGSTGDALVKISDTDYAVGWSSAGGGGAGSLPPDGGVQPITASLLTIEDRGFVRIMYNGPAIALLDGTDPVVLGVVHEGHAPGWDIRQIVHWYDGVNIGQALLTVDLTGSITGTPLTLTVQGFDGLTDSDIVMPIFDGVGWWNPEAFS